jgi:L-iditol 2-dehydrogenase
LLANILIKPGKIEIRSIETPKPSYGEILVRIKAALTCGTDLKAFIRGHPLIPMPGVFGHEFSGVITEVGKGVSRFKKGDAVMAVHSAPCLQCIFCRKRLYNLCEKIMHTKVLGAFAEYIILPSHVVRQNVFNKPRNLSFEEAAFLEPLSCVVHSVEKLRIKKGDSALIFGAGPIGLLHLLLLKRKGAKVAVMDIKNERLKIAKRLGVDFTVRAMVGSSPSPTPLPSREGKSRGDISSRDRLLPSPLIGKTNPIIPSPLEGEGQGEGYMYVKKLTDDIGFDYVFECTGMPEVWEASVNYVRKGGTVILFGGCKSGTTVTYDTGRIHYDEITLKGVFHYTPSDVKKAYKLLCEGGLGVSSLLSGRYPLQHTQKVFDKLAKGAGIKYAIIP